MHTEHLQNVRLPWVLLGWFVSVAITSLVLLGFIAIARVDADASAGQGWALVALVIGFLVGGWFTGARVGLAPILHAVGIALTSLVVWLVANLLGEVVGTTTWNDGSPAFYAAGMLVQIVAAALGARIGSRGTRAGVAPQG